MNFRIFSMNFFDEFFRLLTIASFRIGVPSILFKLIAVDFWFMYLYFFNYVSVFVADNFKYLW